MTNNSLSIKCPHCKKTFVYGDCPSRPFCSERCRLVDLGMWLEEAYKIPVAQEEIEDEENSENSPSEE